MNTRAFVSNSYPTVNMYTAVNSIEDKILESGYLVVVDDNNEFKGILTTLDLIKRPHKLVIDCLTKKESLSVNESVHTIYTSFAENRHSVLPVFEENKFIGIIEKKGILKKLREKIIDLHNKSLISQNTKSEFLNNLSHEIRTPLNGLLGFIDIVSTVNPETISEMHKDIIRRSADRFLMVMSDLIDLSIINSGDDIVIKKEEIKIKELFLELHDFFDTTIKMLNQKVSIEIVNPDTSLIILSDKKRLKQILHHLIDNAVKFSDDNEIVTIGFKKAVGKVKFYIKNKGIPIAEDKKQIIFSVFERHHNCKKKTIAGLGIGLSLVKCLSEILNGEVNFETNNGETTFFFSVSEK